MFQRFVTVIAFILFSFTNGCASSTIADTLAANETLLKGMRKETPHPKKFQESMAEVLWVHREFMESNNKAAFDQNTQEISKKYSKRVQKLYIETRAAAHHFEEMIFKGAGVCFIPLSPDDASMRYYSKDGSLERKPLIELLTNPVSIGDPQKIILDLLRDLRMYKFATMYVMDKRADTFSITSYEELIRPRSKEKLHARYMMLRHENITLYQEIQTFLEILAPLAGLGNLVVKTPKSSADAIGNILFVELKNIDDPDLFPAFFPLIFRHKYQLSNNPQEQKVQEMQLLNTKGLEETHYYTLFAYEQKKYVFFKRLHTIAGIMVQNHMVELELLGAEEHLKREKEIMEEALRDSKKTKGVPKGVGKTANGKAQKTIERLQQELTALKKDSAVQSATVEDDQKTSNKKISLLEAQVKSLEEQLNESHQQRNLLLVEKIKSDEKHKTELQNQKILMTGLRGQVREKSADLEAKEKEFDEMLEQFRLKVQQAEQEKSDLLMQNQNLEEQLQGLRVEMLSRSTSTDTIEYDPQTQPIELIKIQQELIESMQKERVLQDKLLQTTTLMHDLRHEVLLKDRFIGELNHHINDLLERQQIIAFEAEQKTKLKAHAPSFAPKDYGTRKHNPKAPGRNYNARSIDSRGDKS